MKIRTFLCTVMTVLILFSMCGCSKQPGEMPSQQTELTSQLQASQQQLVTLLEALQLDDDYGAQYLDVCIWDHSAEKRIYCFDSRNPAFSQMFLSFLTDTQLQNNNTKPFDENVESLYFSFSDVYSSRSSFEVNAKGQILIHRGASSVHYLSEGSYEKLLSWLTPLWEETEKHYRISHTSDFMTTHTVWDINGNVLEEDTASRNYYLYYLDGGIVHSWIQAGTGTGARSSLFYDVVNGTVSPRYQGQVHSCGKLVSNTEYNAVCISDMFSGEELYRIDTYEYPVAKVPEAALCAYFIEGGTQIVVFYRDENNDVHQQTFDLPEALQEYAGK